MEVAGLEPASPRLRARASPSAAGVIASSTPPTHRQVGSVYPGATSPRAPHREGAHGRARELTPLPDVRAQPEGGLLSEITQPVRQVRPHFFVFRLFYEESGTSARFSRPNALRSKPLTPNGVPTRPDSPGLPLQSNTSIGPGRPRSIRSPLFRKARDGPANPDSGCTGRSRRTFCAARHLRRRRYSGARSLEDPRGRATSKRARPVSCTHYRKVG